jgi:hypothetical protein
MRLIASHARTASATLVNVGLHVVAVGITPLPPTNKLRQPHTREKESHTEDPSSRSPIRNVP